MSDTMSAADRAAHEAASYVRRPADPSAFLVDCGALGAGRPKPLGDVPVDAPVTVTAQVASVEPYFGRTRMVLVDGDGHQVAALVKSRIERAPKAGARIELRGHVVQASPQLPKGLSAYAMRVVS